MKLKRTFHYLYNQVILSSIIWNNLEKATRTQWWLSKLCVFIYICLCIQLIAPLAKDISITLFLLTFAFAVYTQINISVKRLRDIGLSSLFVIALPIPMLGQLLFLILGFVPSEFYATPSSSLNEGKTRDH